MTDLDAFLKEVKSKPFEWGQWECCLFCLEWLKRKGVTDYEPEPYKGRKGALRALRDFPVKNPFDLWLGRALLPVPGGIIAKPSRDVGGQTYGIMSDNYGYFVGTAGLVRMEYEKSDRYWSHASLFPQPI